MIDKFDNKKLYLSPLEDSSGRIVTDFNGLIIGLEMNLIKNKIKRGHYEN